MSSARALLGPDGPLARAFGAYEHRPGQLAMAEAVERALAEDRILFCEAGTGTGKTLAYLVPALASGRKVVVSTARKALQEQIVLRDVPLIERLLGLRCDALLVKGLGNYLCLRRFDELRRAVAADTPVTGVAPPRAFGPRTAARGPELRAALAEVERWAAETETGDVSELALLEESHPVWREVVSGSDTRIGSSCAHFAACHVTTLRRRAEQARLIVCNHHLLFADLALKQDSPAGVLPAYDAVVLDEAHTALDVATSFFGIEVASGRVERMVVDAERAFTGGRSAGDRRAGATAAGREPSAPHALLGRVASEAQKLFAALGSAATQEGRSPLEPQHWPVGPHHALDDALEALVHLAELEPGAALAALGARVQRLRQDLAELASARGARVAWVERRGHGIAAGASPIDVGPWLRDRLFGRTGAAILTSATLGVDGDFSHARRSLGLDTPVATPVDELCLPPAFDYAERALLYTPTDLPEVTAPEFLAAAAARVAALLDLTGGGAFVLCTSQRVMRALAAALGAGGREVLVQGQAPKRALLERFRAHGDAVLVATMSFWEGVDVPGRALRLVAIDRIPFAVPTDPLVRARSELLREQGLDPFAHDALPQAAIVLKQGFGRLLRTRDDYGIVAVLDRRIRTRGYGHKLLQSLPPAERATEWDEVEAFWRRFEPARAVARPR
ncbi:MAG: ATP-dependent DNA helicase [Myxococcales bacterium]|nr:ATP-dependent DNA helicase [Myxococcales bacterium]